jgi:hypothetical protein
MFPTSLSQVTNISSAHYSNWDFLILIAWVAIAFIYSLIAARGRIISVLVAVYMSELVVIQVPFLSSNASQYLGVAGYMGRLLAFLVLFIIFFFILSKYVFRSASEHRGLTSRFLLLIFSLLQIGFLISVIFSFLPPSMKDNFSPLITTIFISQTAVLIWLLLPMVYLVIAGRRMRHRGLE